MSTCQYEGPNHPRFTLTLYPNGVMDLSVCWDSTNIREIAEQLREVANGLDDMPADTTGEGISPL